MSTPFKVRIYEADSTFLIGEIVSLVVPTVDGMYGVMANHRDIVLAIVTGIMHYTLPDGSVVYASVSEGVMEILGGEVLIIADAIELPGEIDEAREREKEAAAKEALLQKRSIQEYKLAEATLKRAISRLTLKNRNDTID